MNKIIWSDLAVKTYTDIIDYLHQEYSLDTALNFDNKLEKLLLQISTFPNSCEKFRLKHLRKCKVDKNVSVLVHPGKDGVELVSFINNRMISF